MEFVTGETKSLHQTPISFLDLSWSPSSSIDLYKFNVNSWVVLESDGSLEPSASPAGLFSWTVDLSSGSIVSVSAGSFDHGSLLSFLHTSAQHYPHRDTGSLTRLALTNAHETASEMVRLSSSFDCSDGHDPCYTIPLGTILTFGISKNVALALQNRKH
jgi:hypothetical protein